MDRSQESVHVAFFELNTPCQEGAYVVLYGAKTRGTPLNHKIFTVPHIWSSDVERRVGLTSFIFGPEMHVAYVVVFMIASTYFLAIARKDNRSKA